MSKFYAVKKGRIPGIYYSWPACQAQINGFSGALHKSFTDQLEALNYIYDGKVPEIERIRAVAPLLAKAKTINIADCPAPVDPSTVKIFDTLLHPDQIEEVEPFYYGTPKMPMVEKQSSYDHCDRSILDCSDHSIMIYIDGSKRTSVNHRGSGAYCRYNRKDFALSCPFTAEIGYRYQFKPEDFSKLSSPTMEYLALSEVLWRFLNFRFPLAVDPITRRTRVKVLNPRIRVTFVSDYIGVKCFTDGSFTAEKDYIIKIRDCSRVVIKYLEERGIDVVVMHVNGHKGMLGNELSDIRAKSQIAFDTIPQLVAEIAEKVAREN